MLRTVALLIGSLVAVPAAAVTLESVVERKSGDWAAVLYRNADSSRLFCAMESHDGDTVIRVVRYMDTNDTFLEIHNSKWKLIEGRAKFSLLIDVNGSSFRSELLGERHSDAYSHTFTDSDMYLALLGMIAEAKSVGVENSNGAEIATFGGRGSGAALRNYAECLKTDWQSEAKELSNTIDGPVQTLGVYTYLSGKTTGAMTVTDMSACEQRDALGCMSAARPLKVQIRTLNRDTGNDCDFEAVEETAGRIEGADGLAAVLVIQDERSEDKPNLSITFDKSGVLVEPQSEAFALGCGVGVGYDGRWRPTPPT